VRAALSQSGLGALLSFDQHNIRYTTSTVIGEWARDKLTRYSLLTATDPTSGFRQRREAPSPVRALLHVDHCKAGSSACAARPAATSRSFATRRRRSRRSSTPKAWRHALAGRGRAADDVRAAEARHRGARRQQ